MRAGEWSAVGGEGVLPGRSRGRGLSDLEGAEGEGCLIWKEQRWRAVWSGRSREGGLSAVEEKGGGSLLWEDRGAVCYGSSRGGAVCYRSSRGGGLSAAEIEEWAVYYGRRREAEGCLL
jgi:hypothetical protein